MHYCTNVLSMHAIIILLCINLYLNFIIIREVDIVTHVTEKAGMHETNLEDECLKRGREEGRERERV